VQIQASTIGTVARQAGVNVETIRYYQRIGLVGEPVRPPGGVRRYPPETIERIRFIKRAQELGFSLEEVAELLRLNDGVHCRDARGLAAKKLALVEARIRDLGLVQRTLKQLIAECDAGKARDCCPIIDSLSAAGRRRN
jgi:MerR family mercuric resistance operon transcriptional regulator